MKKNTNTDWQEIHNRLEVTRHNLENISNNSLSNKNKILKKRAALLAEEHSETVEQDKIEILAFQIADEKYGLETLYVTKILLLNELTFLPGVPTFIIGIINVRGHIIPVIDIKKIFEFKSQQPEQEKKIVVVETQDAKFGIIADQVIGLTLISINEIQSSLPMLSGVRAEYLKGVTNDQLVILDPLKLLSDKHFLVNDEFK